jgi:hypothetical protein
MWSTHLNADMRGLGLHLLHQPRSLHDLGEARIVLDVGRDGHLPAGLVALDHQRLEHCTCRIDGGRVARGARPQDDDFGMLVRHGWQNPGDPSDGTNPELNMGRL